MSRIEYHEGMPFVFVCCLECGNEQEYMGHNVVCEACGELVEEPDENHLLALEDI